MNSNATARRTPWSALKGAIISPKQTVALPREGWKAAEAIGPDVIEARCDRCLRPGSVEGGHRLENT